MKKILLLGGAYTQIPSIITAKRLGYYTITCDYLPDNPGHKYANEYHNVSTTDKEAVLELARRLNVDGVVCYASDPSAATAAYVCEKMGFPTSPYESVEILTNKDKFRDFLRENGFNTPFSKGYGEDEVEQMMSETGLFSFPIMIKPVDSSGSKGVTKVDNISQIKKAISSALKYSRCKRFIAEEYIEKYKYQIAGDGFSVEGKLVFRCFANEHFDSSGINPYVPIGESWPYMMPERIHKKIHDELQRAINLLNMKTQAYNFDVRIDADENVYIMEIGPRNGGNKIPQVTKYATGVDMVEYTIKAAMGESCGDLSMVEPMGFWSCYVVHSNKEGVFDGIWIDENVRKENIVECDMFVEKGQKISGFTGSNGTMGILILKYKSLEEMLYMMDNAESWIKVITKPL